MAPISFVQTVPFARTITASAMGITLHHGDNVRGEACAHCDVGVIPRRALRHQTRSLARLPAGFSFCFEASDPCTRGVSAGGRLRQLKVSVHCTLNDPVCRPGGRRPFQLQWLMCLSQALSLSLTALFRLPVARLNGRALVALMGCVDGRCR